MQRDLFLQICLFRDVSRFFVLIDADRVLLHADAVDLAFNDVVLFFNRLRM